MQDDEFIERVQARAWLPSQAEAKRTTEATLETLSEAQAERFSSDEFRERVADRSGISVPVATHRARAVLAVLSEAVPEEEIEKVRDRLPDDYSALFEARVGRAV